MIPMATVGNILFFNIYLYDCYSSADEISAPLFKDRDTADEAAKRSNRKRIGLAVVEVKAILPMFNVERKNDKK